MVTFPPCKINLGLHILARRTDGYHELETCYYPLPWTDVLEILPATTLQFTTSGLPIPGKKDDNLCLRAYNLLQRQFDLEPVHIHLHKIIPPGSGLGGGSADATFALKMFNDLFLLRQSDDQLSKLASTLGSDCPFFVRALPSMGTGKGDQLEPVHVNLSGFFAVLVRPDFPISTADAYRNVAPATPKNDLRAVVTGSIALWRERLVNDFESSLFIKHPQLSNIKKWLYDEGAVCASLSGSGSCCYGIFKDDPTLRGSFTDWVCWKGRL